MNFTPYNHVSQALSWLLPQHCLQCKLAIKPNLGPVCTHCYVELPFQSNNCRQCGQRYSSSHEYCGRCLNSPPSFDRCFCPFEYKSGIKELICNIKYREKPSLAKAAAQLLAKEIVEQGIELPQAVTPVPMHVKHLRSRGYNHSNLIARHLSRILDITYIENIATKTKATSTQAGLSLKKRKTNLKNSFKVIRNIDFKHIAIIDDVMTTGATAEEIAKILKKNGVDYIQVWGIAHTL